MSVNTAPNIEQLVPHRGAMSLLDGVSAHGPDWVEAVATADESSPFFEDGAIGAWAGIEYMAQAIAAFSGLRARAAGEVPRIGLLVGTRAYHCRVDSIPLGERLLVRAERRFEADNGLASFDCSIRDAAGEVLAEAALTVFQPDDPALVFDGSSA